MTNKLTATLSDGRTIEVEERDGVLVPVKEKVKLRPAPLEVYVLVCGDGSVGNAWKTGESDREAERVESGELVRYVRDDPRYQSQLYSSTELIKGGTRTVIYEVPHE